jgi:DNA-binding transcriptional LysR family regulator
LLAVAEEQSFIAAAARLQLAQPALSRQIQDFERELGTELFLRTSHGTHVTEAGQAAVRSATTIIEGLRDAVERARRAERGLAGICVLGAGRYPMWNGLLARLVEQVRTEYPGIEIVVDERALPAQWEALAACEIDIAFGTAPPAEYGGFVVESHTLDVIDAVVVSRTHPLASRASVTLADLERYAWIRHAPSVRDEPTRILQSLFLARRFTPTTTRHALNDDALRMMVRAGAGWSALPHSLRAVLPASLVAIPVDDLAVPFRYVHFHRGGDARPVIRSVLGTLRRSARGSGGILEPDSGVKVVPAPGSRAAFASRIELRHLKYFAAVIEHETLGRAAEEVGITQPALSRQVRDLEDEIGVSLLQRSARGTRPTLAGESFYSDAKRILAAADQLRMEAHRALRGTARRCVIGVASSPLLWDLVTRVVANGPISRHPVEIVVEGIPTPDQPQAIADGRIDIALGHVSVSPADVGPGISRTVIVGDRLNVALLGARHPLAQRSDIALAELGATPFLFMKRAFSAAFYDQVMATLARASYEPRIDGAYDGLPTIWALAAHGLGWALGSASQKLDPPSGLVGVSLRDFDMPWGCELFHRRDECRAAVQDVLQLIREAAQLIAIAA